MHQHNTFFFITLQFVLYLLLLLVCCCWCCNCKPASHKAKLLSQWRFCGDQNTKAKVATPVLVFAVLTMFLQLSTFNG